MRVKRVWRVRHGWDGTLRAFDAATGAERWSASPESGFAQSYSVPAVDGGVLYLGSGDGEVRAYDAATGQPRWATPLIATGSRAGSSACSLGPTLALAVSGGVEYAVGCDGVAYALDAATRTSRWVGGRPQRPR